jgi:hypothetical protein
MLSHRASNDERVKLQLSAGPCTGTLQATLKSKPNPHSLGNLTSPCFAHVLEIGKDHLRSGGMNPFACFQGASLFGATAGWFGSGRPLGYFTFRPAKIHAHTTFSVLRPEFLGYISPELHRLHS